MGRLTNTARGAGEHDAVVEGLGPDLGSRQLLRQLLVQIGDLIVDIDFDGGDLLALRVQEDRVRLAELQRHDEDASRRAHDGVGNRRIADEDVTSVRVQLDDRRLVEPERQMLRHGAWRRRDMDDAGLRCRLERLRGGGFAGRCRGNQDDRRGGPAEQTHYLQLAASHCIVPPGVEVTALITP